MEVAKALSFDFIMLSVKEWMTCIESASICPRRTLDDGWSSMEMDRLNSESIPPIPVNPPQCGHRRWAIRNECVLRVQLQLVLDWLTGKHASLKP
jgi:hypothetical protein